MVSVWGASGLWSGEWHRCGVGGREVSVRCIDGGGA